eukprot:11352163-Alexandrium_andersonii.AAC.1
MVHATSSCLPATRQRPPPCNRRPTGGARGQSSHSKLQWTAGGRSGCFVTAMRTPARPACCPRRRRLSAPGLHW